MIGSNLTVSGPDFSNLAQLQQAIQLAINQQDHIGRFRLGYLPLDDYLGSSFSQAKGVQNVKHMIANARVLGMIGPAASSMAYVEIPAANPSDLVILSPSNTNECVTRRSHFALLANRLGNFRATPTTTSESLRPILFRVGRWPATRA